MHGDRFRGDREVARAAAECSGQGATIDANLRSRYFEEPEFGVRNMRKSLDAAHPACGRLDANFEGSAGPRLRLHRALGPSVID